MDRSDAFALADLQMHWDEAYVIGLDGDIWSARYHTSADELRAHTSSELRELIRSDYTYRQRVDPASRYSDKDADEQDEDEQDEDEQDEDGLADGAAGAREQDVDGAAGAREQDEDGLADGPAVAGETETRTGGQTGDPSADPGEDAGSAARRTAADVNFAAIRGERMST
jgi:hypothetical protein